MYLKVCNKTRRHNISTQIASFPDATSKEGNGWYMYILRTLGMHRI